MPFRTTTTGSTETLLQTDRCQGPNKCAAMCREQYADAADASLGPVVAHLPQIATTMAEDATLPRSQHIRIIQFAGHMERALTSPNEHKPLVFLVEDLFHDALRLSYKIAVLWAPHRALDGDRHRHSHRRWSHRWPRTRGMHRHVVYTTRSSRRSPTTTPQLDGILQLAATTTDVFLNTPLGVSTLGSIFARCFVLGLVTETEP